MILRIASVPAEHPYVAHLAPVDDDAAQVRVERLPDPPVIQSDGQVRWWPPRMLDPIWLREHAAAYDVLHVHFGFESFSVPELQSVAGTLRDLGKPLVVTVHDLRNPHVADATAHLDRLGALVEAAAEVITLTPGAAAEIRRRWGRTAHIVPHPHIVPLDLLDAIPSRAVTEKSRQRIGLHLKSFRRNVDALGALRALEIVATARAVDCVVTMHAAVADPADRGYDAEVVTLAQQLSREDHIELVLHEPMSDEDLFAYVRSLDVSVMANVWGTHSGWIEMCHDLGVRVVAPHIGFYAEQHAPLTYDLAPQAERIDPHRVAQALTQALDLPRPHPANRPSRTAERRAIAQAHTQIYADAIRKLTDVHSTSPSSAKARNQPSIGH